MCSSFDHTHGGASDSLEPAVHTSWLCLSRLAEQKRTSLTTDEREVRRRIETLVESVKDDRTRSNQLFHYVWTMMCVRRGLLRVVREIHTNGTQQLLLEEVTTGQRRLVVRPGELDTEIEGLAVQALARMLRDDNRA